MDLRIYTQMMTQEGQIINDDFVIAETDLEYTFKQLVKLYEGYEFQRLEIVNYSA